MAIATPSFSAFFIFRFFTRNHGMRAKEKSTAAEKAM